MLTGCCGACRVFVSESHAAQHRTHIHNQAHSKQHVYVFVCNKINYRMHRAMIKKILLLVSVLGTMTLEVGYLQGYFTYRNLSTYHTN